MGLKTDKKNPCYGCEERSAGCHSTCEKYEKWKTELHEKGKYKAISNTEYYQYTQDRIIRRYKK